MTSENWLRVIAVDLEELLSGGFSVEEDPELQAWFDKMLMFFLSFEFLL